VACYYDNHFGGKQIMQLRKTHFLMVLVSVMVAMLLAACVGAAPIGGGGNTTTGGGGGDPAAGARSFFEAVFTGAGDLDPLLCTANAAAAAQIREGMETLKTMLAAGDAEVDVSGLTYTTSNQTADTATVTVAGQIKFSVAGVEQTQDFPEAPVQMRNEGGSWKVCG
jgi:hypothetical protein